jgi:hypothetical protein
MHEIAYNLLLEGFVQLFTHYTSQYHELTTYSDFLSFKIPQILDQKSLTLEGLAQA